MNTIIPKEITGIGTSKEHVLLFDFEVNHNGYKQPISSITWFQGDPSIASRLVRDRIKDVMVQNPWLGGVLQRKNRTDFNSPKENALELVFHKSSVISEEEIDKIFRFERTDAINLGMDLNSLFQVTSKQSYQVKVGNDLIDSDEPVLKITIHNNPNEIDRFALILSLSHMVGDACTFYCIKNMIISSNNIAILNPVRNAKVIESIEKSLGRSILSGSNGIWVTLLGFLRKVKRSRICKQKIFVVNQEFIIKEKTLHAEKEGQVSYVSSNDGKNKMFELIKINLELCNI